MTDPTGLSFWDSPEPLLGKNGQKIWAIDAQGLNGGIRTGNGLGRTAAARNGHSNVFATPEAIKDATIPHGPNNPLEGAGFARSSGDSCSYKIPGKKK